MALNPIIASLLSIVFIVPAAPAEAQSDWLSTGQMPIESEFLKAHSEPPSPAPSIPDESKQVPEAKTPPEPVASSPSITGASIPEQIRQVWGVHAEKALRVARCESGFRTTARNGQHLGIFQMGRAERARFGHGPDAPTQIAAAFGYFQVSGWQPWRACT